MDNPLTMAMTVYFFMIALITERLIDTFPEHAKGNLPIHGKLVKKALTDFLDPYQKITVSQ